MKLCILCGSLHQDGTAKCFACMVITGKHTSATPVQSQSEVEWADHVEDHKHEQDWLRDGHGSE